MATQTTDLELRIRAALEGIESVTGFTAELRDTGAATAELTADAAKLDSALSALAGLQQQIQQHRDLQRQLTETAAALEAAREKQRGLSQQVVESLGPTQQQLREQQRADAAAEKLTARLEAQRAKVRDLGNEMDAAGAPSARLTAQYESARSKLDALGEQLAAAKQRQEEATKAVKDGGEPNARLIRLHEKQTDTVESLEAQLQHLESQLQHNAQALDAAGVKTGQLDEASARIAQTFEDVAAKAKAFADAQANLKFIPHEQLEREAQGLRDSYEVLRSSGKLSAQELAQANLKLQEGLLDLERQTNGWKESLVQAKVEIGAAIAAFAPIAISIKQASDFETALAGVRKVVDGTDEQFAGLTDRIRELSRELPISAEGLADIAAAGGQLGVPIDKLDQFIELAAQVSVAFNVTAEQAGQAVAELANIFDLPLEKVGELASSINVLGNTTAATEGQILEFLTRVGGSARQFGLTAEAVAALGASLIAMGRTPEVAATAVNALLVRLQAANVLAPKAQAALEGIGLSAAELARQIRENPQAALETFLGTLEQLDDQARTEAIAQILGVEQADKIASLVGNIEQYREALKSATDQQQVSGALQKEFDAQAQTTAKQYELLRNVLADITLQIGTAFLPAVKAAIAAGKSVAEAIATVVESAPGLTAVAVTLVSVGAAMSGLRIATAAARVAITGLLGSVGSLVPSLTAAGGAATAAATAVTGLGRALALVPRFLGVGIALAGAEAVIAALINIRNIQRDLAEAEAKVQAELQAGIDAASARAVQYTGLAQGSATAIEAIAAGTEQLTASQRAHYAAVLDAAEQYLRAQIAIGVREQELAGQTSVNMAAVRAELGQVRAARAALQAEIDSQRPLTPDQVIDPAVLERVRALGDEIKTLSAQDLAALTASAQRELGTVSAVIADAAQQFPALSGAARDAALAMDGRFAPLIQAQRDLGAAVDALRTEQFARLGVDASAVLTGIDAEAKELLETFRSLMTDPDVDPRLKLAAFDALLKRLDSPQELEALRESLERSNRPAEQLEQAMQQVNQRLAEMPGVATSAEEQLRAALEASEQLAEQSAERQIQSAQEVAAAQQAAAGQTSEAFDALMDQLGNAETQADIDRFREASTTAFRDGAISADEYTASLRAANQQSEALANASVGFAAALGNYVSALRASYAAVSEDAAAAFDAVNERAAISDTTVSNYLSSLASGVAGLNQVITEQQAQADGLIGRWSALNAQIASGAEATRYFGANSDHALVQSRQSLEGYINALRSAIANMEYLDAQRLTQLQSALAAAQSRMDSLRASAQSALASVQDELDRLRGNTDAIEDRRQRARLAELEAQLAQARAAGDQASINALNQAIAKQRELMRLIAQQRQEEAQQAEQPSPQPRPQPTPAPPPQPTPTPLPPPAAPAPAMPSFAVSRVVEVRFVIVDQTYSLYGDEATAQALLDELARAKSVTY